MTEPMLHRTCSGPDDPVRAERTSGGREHSVTGLPTWIRTGDDPDGALAAWVHSAGRSVRGVLVVAPPLGREHVISYRTVRTLCCRAAEAGFAAVRFDWTGHGDSREPRPRADLAARWTADLEAVIDRAQAAAPGAPVTVVGLRLGAAALAGTRWAAAPEAAQPAAASTGEVRLIGWAPVSGRAFLREHTVLRRISLSEVPPAPSDMGAEISGDLLDPEQAASLRRLAAPRTSTAAMTVLSAQPGEELAWAAAFRYAHVPTESLAEILAHAAQSERAHSLRWPRERSAAQPVHGGSAVCVKEAWTPVGVSGIWGVTVEPLSGKAQRSVVFTAPDAEPRHGPSRLWTRAARPLAQRGCSSLRADRTGTGDSADPRELTEPNPYTEQTVRDVTATICHQSAAQGAPVSAVGLCAGAWAAARAAAHAPVDELILINNAAWSADPRTYRRLYQDSRITAALGGGQELEQAPDSPRARLYRALKVVHRNVELVAPRPLRRLGQRFGLLEDALGLLPPGLLAGRTSIWSMPGDLEALARAGGRHAMRRWREAGASVTLRPLMVPDHALLSAAARREVQQALIAALGAAASPGPGTSVHPVEAPVEDAAEGGSPR